MNTHRSTPSGTEGRAREETESNPATPRVALADRATAPKAPGRALAAAARAARTASFATPTPAAWADAVASRSDRRASVLCRCGGTTAVIAAALGLGATIARSAEQPGSIAQTDRARHETGRALLGDVAEAWRGPTAEGAAGVSGSAEASSAAVLRVRRSPAGAKLDAIRVAAVSFNATPLSKVAPALAALAHESDLAPAAGEGRGVNIVLIDPSGTDPGVTLALRDLPLRRVLELVCESVGYQFEVRRDAVVVRPAGAKPALATEVFPVPRATIVRMIGAVRGDERGGGNAGSTAGAAAFGSGSSAGGGVNSALDRRAAAERDESAELRGFLQRAGVDFEGMAGSALVYDGAALIVTHAAPQLDRLALLLERFRDVRQVEIEAKFMEVQEGALEELGIQWTAARSVNAATGQPRELYASPLRTLGEAFAGTSGKSAILIDGAEVASVGTPGLPGAALLGNATAPLARVTGFLGEFDVGAVVRALQQKQGTDLLSAPKVTVLSGVEATISVAQELRYPRQFGQIQSQVGTTSGQNNGSAGVTITAGTPQDFATQDIGVELRVRPRVEDDGAISLELHPVVTEFEGFVEYGGQSLAISGGRTVTIPSGFFQPIFSRRQVSTQVTLRDGATLVMGGLTREDVKKSSDKVPGLGNLPAVGRLFRSKGESTMKRSLLIFVTARLVTPDGGPVRFAAVEPSGVSPAVTAAPAAPAGR